MRPFQSTTAVQQASFLQQINRWPLALRHLHQRIASCFARPQPRQHALLYLQAILSDIPRKNGWQIAEHAHLVHPYGIQRLLSQAVWDEHAVRDALRTTLLQPLLPFWSSMRAAFPNAARTPLASLPSTAACMAASRIARSACFSRSSPPWAMASSTATCTCLPSGARMLSADTLLISPSPSAFRPNPTWPCACSNAPSKPVCPFVGSSPIPSTVTRSEEH